MNTTATPLDPRSRSGVPGPLRPRTTARRSATSASTCWPRPRRTSRRPSTDASGRVTGTIAIKADSADGSTLNVTIRNNTITQGSPNHGNQGIELSPREPPSHPSDVENNKVGTRRRHGRPRRSTGTGINIANGSAGDSVMVGKIAGHAAQTTRPSRSPRATVSASGCSTSTRALIQAAVTGNLAQQTSADYGIQAAVVRRDLGAVRDARPTRRRHLQQQRRVGARRPRCDSEHKARNSNTVCAKINGNTTDMGSAPVSLAIFVRQANTAVFQLEGWDGMPAAAAFVTILVIPRRDHRLCRQRIICRRSRDVQLLRHPRGGECWPNRFFAEIRHHDLRFRAERLGALQRAILADQPEPSALFAAGHDLRRRWARRLSLPAYLRGRAAVHTGGGLAYGERVGELAHTLTITELPAHVHGVNASSSPGDGVVPTNTVLPAR